MLDTAFKALDDSTRRRILDLLRREDLAAGAIAEHFQVSKPTISHHLDLLKQADLILAERRGQFIVYSLNTSVVDDCIAWLLKLKEKGSRHEPAKKRIAAGSGAAHTVLRRRSALGQAS
jgi:DNA-binding transcriptional ArsR family regulator